MSSSSDTPRGHILLVEDSLDQAHLITFLLEQAGFKVTLAQDGIRGCQLAEDGDWILVLTDLNLPGKDGMEVITAAKSHAPDTPVLAMTGYSGQGYGDQAMRAGADDVLVKPVDKDELLRTVEVLVRRAEATRAENRRRILAVGAYPGALEFGAGATLLAHAEAGDQVILCPVTTGAHLGVEESLRARAEQAAKVLRGSLIPESLMLDRLHEQRATDMVLRMVRELDPEILYTHSGRDRDPVVETVHRATVSGAGGVPTLLCYESPTSAVGFRPDQFEPMASLSAKLEIVRAYEGLGGSMLFADPSLVEATARYWGRHGDTEFAEGLEVVWAG
jgi:CheY-like chemotaxis protein